MMDMAGKLESDGLESVASATGVPPRSAVPTDAVTYEQLAQLRSETAPHARSREDEYYERDAPYTEWLKWYRELEYPRYRHPDVTVDCVILTVDEQSLRSRDRDAAARCLKALVVDRWTHPFRGSVALPGTFMRPDDRNEHAVIARMLRDRFDFEVGGESSGESGESAGERAAAERARAEEGGKPRPRVAAPHIRQLKTFTGRDRDPRGQVVSIANVVYLQRGIESIPEHEGVHWEPLTELAKGTLAFDHQQILATARDRVRSQFAWAPHVFWTLPTPFTVTDALKLRASLFEEDYKSINRKNFKRKYQSVWVPDHVEINPVTKMPVDFYQYEGAVFE